MTVVEVAGLVAVILAGSPQFADLPERWRELIPREFSAWQAVASAAILSFYAFLGFEDMLNIAEEVRDVRRAMPRAIVITLAATTLLYVLVTTVAVLTVSPQELAASDSPLVLVFERSGGLGAGLGLVALVALMNGALIQVVKAARVLFGLANQGSLPAVLGTVHPRTRTPLRATLLATLVAALFAGLLPPGDVGRGDVPRDPRCVRAGKRLAARAQRSRSCPPQAPSRIQCGPRWSGRTCAG